jgi:beta-glucosidase
VQYANITTSHSELATNGSITISADVTNTGERAVDEIAQLYVRDVVGNVTRPVRELKGFTRVHLPPGERHLVRFTLTAEDLAFYGRAMRRLIEPGQFHVWIGGDSTTELRTEFTLVA